MLYIIYGVTVICILVVYGSICQDVENIIYVSAMSCKCIIFLCDGLYEREIYIVSITILVL